MNSSRKDVLTLMDQNRYSEALQLLTTLIKNDPMDWGLYYMAGQCCRFMNEIRRAIELLAKANSLKPNIPEVLLSLGIAFQLEEKFDESISILKKVIALAPNFYSAYNSIGLTYKKISKYREAIEWYSKATDGLLDAARQIALKDEEKCYRYEQENGEKICYVMPFLFTRTHELLKSDPIYAIIKNNIGVCLIELGDFGAAREQFEESIEFIPEGYNYLDPYINLENM